MHVALHLIHLVFTDTSSEMVSVGGWLSKSQEEKQGEKTEVCQTMQNLKSVKQVWWSDESEYQS